jgi:ferrochelatase
VSPINAQNRQLKQAIEADFASHGITLPVYWGNRNWHPMLAETIGQMAQDGVKQALAFVTSAMSSYSGCRQYRENMADAREAVGPQAPVIDKLRVFYNHPGFVLPVAENTRLALAKLPSELRKSARVLFTAHSIPLSMAENCRYEAQLQEACRLVAGEVGQENWELVYQSRSGPPQQPWLEPDVCDRLEELHATRELSAAVIVPIGFVSDHIEILYDLDTEARDVCERLGVPIARAATVGTHPRFVEMIRELVVERMTPGADRLALGSLGASHDVCPVDCCLYNPRPPAPRGTAAT